MTRLFNTLITTILKTTAVSWVLLQTFFSHGQEVSRDLNRHIKTDDPKETIVYTALKKGYVSLKAEIRLVKGTLRTPNGLSFEDFFLKPLLGRSEENGGRIYQSYSGLFYLFVKIQGDELVTFQALESMLLPYTDIIAGMKWNQQRNPLKIVLINASPALTEKMRTQESSLISLEGDYSFFDKGADPLQMPVVGLNYEIMDSKSLRIAVKTLHRQGKKLRLYNVPEDEKLWKTLISSGVDFINTKKPRAILATTH